MTSIVMVTDLFGDEPNYSWVHRYRLGPMKSDLAMVRAAKRLAGWTGMRCRKDVYGDIIVLRPVGSTMVMNITPEE